VLFQAPFLVDCAAKSALIVNQKLQALNFGEFCSFWLDFVPAWRMGAVLFKLATVSESAIEALVSPYNSDPSSDIALNLSL
jgi:hypothetical protein